MKKKFLILLAAILLVGNSPIVSEASNRYNEPGIELNYSNTNRKTFTAYRSFASKSAPTSIFYSQWDGDYLYEGRLYIVSETRHLNYTEAVYRGTLTGYHRNMIMSIEVDR